MPEKLKRNIHERSATCTQAETGSTDQIESGDLDDCNSKPDVSAEDTVFSLIVDLLFTCHAISLLSGPFSNASRNEVAFSTGDKRRLWSP